MASYNPPNSLTKADYVNGIPVVYDDLLRYDSSPHSITAALEGPENSKSAILRKDDVTKKAGETFHFETLGYLMGKGRGTGEKLQGYEEKPALGRFTLTVSLKRHAVSRQQEVDDLALFKVGEWARPQLAEWFGRRMDNDAFVQYITTDVQKQIYAGNATAVTNLRKLDGTISTLSVASLRKAGITLESSGAPPIITINKKGRAFPIYGAFISTFDKYNLMLDPAFEKLNMYANVAGEDNPVFTGAFGLIGNILCYQTHQIRGDGGALRPEAKIHGAHAADAVTIVVGADETGIIDYTEFFPASGTLSILGEDGKTEYVTYAAKTTYSFTTCTRAVTYGDVTSVAAAYTGGDTNEEYVSLGHFQSKIICFGAQSMMRAFAKNTSHVVQKSDYDEEMGIGIRYIAGHKAVKNSNGKNKSYLILNACSFPSDAALN
jgi:N4-gp56 family major capsid protein